MMAPGVGFPDRHRIGVIVLNYNGAALTRACVESVLAHTDPACDYAVLVVDNGSAPADCAALAPLAELARVRVIHSRINLGYGGGHAFGMQFLRAEHYLFLNSDCLFHNDVVSALAAFMDENPRAGLASGITFDAEGAFRANWHPAPHLAELLLGRSLMRRFHPARYPDRHRIPDSPIEVEEVGGAALYVRAEAFFEVGGFDPFFFLYCEEEDLALRLRRAGWGVWVTPAARIEHAMRGSTPKDIAYRREFFISFFHYFRKHHAWPVAFAMRMFYALKLLRRTRREPGAAALAWFVFKGASPAASLRFRQGPTDDF
ncbi:MAG: glycosyltransferase family 2 protein [Gammaproteobacteria bacterium]